MDDQEEFRLECPTPVSGTHRVLLAHGGGGRLMQTLIHRVFYERFDNPHLRREHDGAVLPRPAGRLAMTTDSYVVRPLFFPGGDIGRLAVYGTVNDLAMCGARPLYLSAGFILEEGLPMETLERLASSMAEAAETTGVALVTGDTKVVDKGRGDGVYLNTTGIGVVPDGVAVGPQWVRAGHKLVLSGDLGNHGIAVLSVRDGLAFDGSIESDAAPLHAVVGDLLDHGIAPSCLRDLTRGGLASALNEIAGSADLSVVLQEADIPVRDSVRGACELLGLDPLYVANEGRFVAVVPPDQAEATVQILRAHAVSADARVVGEVTQPGVAPVLLRTTLGTTRILDLLSGEQMPRIC